MSKKKTFEELFTELEAIVVEMESGELDLEKSVTLFEKGVSISDQIKKQLTGTEQKITELIGRLEHETD